MTTSDLKRTACEAIDGRQEALTGLSLDLWAHPETHYDERHAHRSLTAFLTDAGFDVQQHYKLETAFRATFGAGGPRVAVMCEYDALPEMGHACGHNLIAMTGVGAGLGVMAALKAAGSAGTIIVLGTPAEEEGCGKIDLIRAGAFDDIDVALMAHPDSASAVHLASLAIHTLSIRFVGKASHAAGFPWQGVNALDAAVVCYTSISCLRQQLKPTWRVHGIITNGGVRPNIIPEETEMLYYIRAPTMRELVEFKDRIRICVEGAATATGCTVTYEFDDKPMAEVVTNKVLARLYQDNAESLGVSFLDPQDPQVTDPCGSTDMGNVTQAVPGIHAYFQITSSCNAHTREFTTASASPEGHASAMTTSKALAMTVIDVITQPDVMTSVRETFERDMGAAAAAASSS